MSVDVDSMRNFVDCSNKKAKLFVVVLFILVLAIWVSVYRVLTFTL